MSYLSDELRRVLPTDLNIAYLADDIDTLEARIAELEAMVQKADMIVKDCIQTLINNGYDDAAKCLQDVHFGMDDPV